MPREKTRVLFINSPRDVGADTRVHFLVLEHLDRDVVECHAAGQPGIGLDELARIERVRVRPTDFGPSLSGTGRSSKAAAAFRALPAALDLIGLARYVRRHGIEVLHSTDRPRDAIACALLSSLTGAKAVIHVHVKFGDWMGRGVRWAFGRADALIGVSNFVAESLVRGGYDRSRVHAVLNATELGSWDPTMDTMPGRRALGVADDAPFVVSVARLFHWKGHNELIQAIAVVKRRIRDVRLAIVGADYPEGSGVSARLKARARELGVEENVIFTGHRNDIASLLAASDVFSLPSFEEPFGLVFVEAMAMKRPVVALDNGGTPEVVRAGETGLLSPPGDIQALGENLIALLESPALRREMGERGRLDVEARFTPERLARDVEAVYRSLLA